ncbi:hypothetical protein SteCoe_14763 [Stentor coeruleus]|uniref:Ubiquitin-like protease family profile domain-containing protein n=1 Tax=Stentor coeruleus TaxID=5963 RepID=A0A1R2C5E1_9CILI|nr:hypothetical protein SteCoe_14763 [Stentor coeruleus]
MSSNYKLGMPRRDIGVDAFSVASITESMVRTSLDSSTPYARIFRKSNVYAGIMPNFLRQQHHSKGITSEDLRRLEIQAIPTYSTPSFQQNSSSIQKKMIKIVEDIRRIYFVKENSQRDISALEAQVNSVLSKINLEFTINIKKWAITGEELSKLVDNRDVSSRIINALMQHLKQLNKVSLKSGDTIIRANFYSVELAESVLIKGALTKLQNLLIGTYDLHLFPIFHHYWKLVVYSSKNHIAKVYDLGHNYSEAELYIENLENLWSYNEQATTGIKHDLQMQKGINLWNSGLYICATAYKLIMGQDENLTSDELSDFRLDMLITLLKLSQINIATI